MLPHSSWNWSNPVGAAPCCWGELEEYHSGKWLKVQHWCHIGWFRQHQMDNLNKGFWHKVFCYVLFFLSFLLINRSGNSAAHAAAKYALACLSSLCLFQGNLPATLAFVCEEDARTLSVFCLIYWRFIKKKKKRMKKYRVRPFGHLEKGEEWSPTERVRKNWERYTVKKRAVNEKKREVFSLLKLYL